MRRRRPAQSTLVRVAAGEAGISGKDLQFNTGDGSEVRITPLSLSWRLWSAYTGATRNTAFLSPARLAGRARWSDQLSSEHWSDHEPA